MIKELQLEYNREQLVLIFYKLQIEAMIEKGTPLSSPIIVDLKNKFDNHLIEAMKLKQLLDKAKKKHSIIYYM